MEHIILKFLQGTAYEGEKQILLKWIRESESNKKEFDEIRDLWISTGDAFSEISFNMGVFDRFKQRITDHEIILWRKKNLMRIFRYAASVAVLIALSYGMFFLGYRNAKNVIIETVVNQTIVSRDKTPIILPDNTKVWLNKGGKLSFPESFKEDRRVVTLEGEAYFEVAHNEKVPFFVETNDITIKVLGTEFNVKNYSGSNFSETVLLSGNVEIDMKNEKGTVVLYPNQKISYNKQTGNHSIEKVDAQEYSLWKNDKLIINNEELEQIFKKIEKWYNVNISYSNDLPLKSKYSITITDEPKEEVLRLLSIILPIRYNLENDKIIIRKK